jgi:hypothetical protein
MCDVMWLEGIHHLWMFMFGCRVVADILMFGCRGVAEMFMFGCIIVTEMS